MKIAEIISYLESLAPLSLQEEYDNAGLITGDASHVCSGILCCLDATEEVIREAVSKKINLVVAHHPIIFRGLKKITGKNYVERSIIAAIRNDVAIYAIHTNLDNVLEGVNGRIAQLIGLETLAPLFPKEAVLKKLFTFVSTGQAEKLRNALFSAGGGYIGNYSECSFNSEGVGTFRANEHANPYVGEIGKQHQEQETKIELVFPAYLEQQIISTLKKFHPYEEPAFDIISLDNSMGRIGAGVLGQLAQPMKAIEFLDLLKKQFRTGIIRHTRLIKEEISKVAICGGAGSFLISRALSQGADIFVTSDIKYHEFFDAHDRMILADIGHYESEQFTINLLQEILAEKFPTFAVLKTGINTNPVHYS